MNHQKEVFDELHKRLKNPNDYQEQKRLLIKILKEKKLTVKDIR